MPPHDRHYERHPTHAPCLDTVAYAHAASSLPFAPERVFDCVRNLGCLVHWWPGARGIVATPPGVYAAGDVALLQLAREAVAVRVIAYKPGRRIVLSMQYECRRLLVDLSVQGNEAGSVVRLSIEAPRESNWLAAKLQALRLRSVCRTAAARLVLHLRNSPVLGPMRTVQTLEA